MTLTKKEGQRKLYSKDKERRVLNYLKKYKDQKQIDLLFQ